MSSDSELLIPFLDNLKQALQQRPHLRSFESNKAAFVISASAAEPVGAGSFGEVVRGITAATGERVAIKRLLVKDDVNLKLARQEADNFAHLTNVERSSPHVVRLRALFASSASGSALLGIVMDLGAASLGCLLKHAAGEVGASSRGREGALLRWEEVMEKPEKAWLRRFGG